MSNARIVYRPSDLAPEQARDIRARALRFVLDCYDKKKGDAGYIVGNGKEIRDVPANNIIPR